MSVQCDLILKQEAEPTLPLLVLDLKVLEACFISNSKMGNSVFPFTLFHCLLARAGAVVRQPDISSHGRSRVLATGRGHGRGWR